MKRTNSIKLRRIKYFFGNNIKKILSFPFAVIKLILSPLYIARAVFFPAKRSKYPRLDSNVYNELNKINRHINPSKNQIHCLEDNMDMVLNKIKALEDGANILIKCVEAGVKAEKDIEALQKDNRTHMKCFNGMESSHLKYLIDTTAKKVAKLQLDASDLTFLPADDDFEVTAKDNDFEVTANDDDCAKVFREEYDYHKESEYWTKRGKEAYEDHISEPKRRHND